MPTLTIRWWMQRFSAHRSRHRSFGRRLGRVAVVMVAALTGLATGAGVASAHVTVNPNSATGGSYAKLTFRVPTESATATTVSLQVSLPTDHPFPSVSVMQVPGWTAKVVKETLANPVTQGDLTIKEAVTSITWTADDGVGIKLGEFNEFAISVGPVPNVPSMQFPAAQTYSDGSVVKWDQSAGADGSEPEHPAPTLTIASAAADHGVGSDTTARTLAVIGIVLAALALLVGVFGLRRRAGDGTGAAS